MSELTQQPQPAEAPLQIVDKNEGESYGAFVKRQFKKNKMGVASVYVILTLSFIAIFADFLANDKPIVAQYKGALMFPVINEYGVMMGLTEWGREFSTVDWKSLQYDWAIFPPVPYTAQSTNKNLTSLADRKPSSKHYLGTDGIGRDVCAGIIHGSRYALSIGIVAMSIALFIGIILGAVAGFFGGVTDILISRLIEIVITFPRFFLIITIVAMIEQGSIWLIMGIIGFTGWTSIARFMRGEVLRVRNLDFVNARNSTWLLYKQNNIPSCSTQRHCSCAHLCSIWYCWRNTFRE